MHHPPAAPGGAHHATQQFLSSVLSQRGPDALPYAEDTKYLIRHHLVTLAEAFPSLVPRASQFVHNDGRTVRLLQADGTIPIVYAGVVYNIPSTIWLLEPYPRSPPSVFLSPTRDMVVKPNHPHVDRSGHVLVPYLRSWVFPSSNLVDLVRSLSHLFSLDPPLYTRQQPTSTPNPTPPIAYSRPTSSPPASSYSRPSPPLPTSSPARPSEDPAEVFRRNAINKVIDMVHRDVVALRRRTEAEMEGLFAAQAELKRREEALAMGLKEMQEEKEELEHQLQIMLMNADVLENWWRENSTKMGADHGDADGAFEPCDVLSKQALECTSVDMAIDDTIYALDRVLQEGVVGFEAYVRAVRALAREQFFHRATTAKVKAAQVQVRVSNMAARVPQYAT